MIAATLYSNRKDGKNELQVASTALLARVIFRIRPSSILGQSLTYFRKICDRYVIAT